MSGDTRGYALDVSDDLFKLTTESLRLHSNATKRYQTLASLVNERAGDVVDFDHHDNETLRSHFALIPTKGDVRIYLSVSRRNADALVDAKRRVAKRLGISLTVADALSLLLLDFVAEAHAEPRSSEVPDRQLS